MCETEQRGALVFHVACHVMCPYPIYLRKTNLFVPCGKCGSCLRRKISDYILRCQVEAKDSLSSYFITLTYETNPLQIYKSDLQGFFKRLRRAGLAFSYFALGDYGDTFGRPHYHVLLFCKSDFPSRRYIDRIWQSGRDVRATWRGFVRVDPVSLGRISYVVRYGFVAKLDWDKNDKRTKPFFLMSKRPALGASYVARNKHHYRRLNKWYFQDGQYKKPMPRYYRDKIFTVHQRELHSLEYNHHADAVRDKIIAEIALTSDRPHEKYYERIEESARLFLDKLRKQKKLKNKLL